MIEKENRCVVCHGIRPPGRPCGMPCWMGSHKLARQAREDKRSLENLEGPEITALHDDTTVFE
jgi:hypothetical protein